VILIWGWRVRRKTLSAGIFYSPAAGRDGPYRLIEARRWFTFFWIPLIPLKRLGTFVECQQTKATYDPAILENPTNSDFVDQLSAAVREVVVAVVVADGAVTDDERRLAVDIIRDQIGPDYTPAAFEEDLGRAMSSPLDQRLQYLAGALNDQGKERLLTAAARAMTADGSIDDRDRAAVRRIGELLGMSPAHVRGVSDQVEESSLSGP
jgi:tellurite resistance protein